MCYSLVFPGSASEDVSAVDDDAKDRRRGCVQEVQEQSAEMGSTQSTEEAMSEPSRIERPVWETGA